MSEKIDIIKTQEVLGYECNVYGTWEKPLFLAKAVAEWIDYDKSNVSKMVKLVDEDEKVRTNVTTLGGEQEAWFVTEDGLYEILMQSRKPIAKEWKKEVKKILKEIRLTGQFQTSTLSPQLQLLIQMERQQQQLGQALEQTNQRIASIRDVVALDVTSWRKDSRELLGKIALSLGGYEHLRELNTEVYRSLEERASVKLGVRLAHKRQRMAEEGVCKSKRDKVTKLDIVAEDKKLVEIYLAIVKKMAVKYGVGCNSEIVT